MQAANHLKERLRMRRWEAPHIRRAIQALHREPSLYHQRINGLIIFISVVGIILGNLLLSLLLIPLMLSLSGIFLYVIIIVLGAIIGFMFEMLTRSIQTLEHHHHVLLSISIPLLSLLTTISIALYANDLALQSGIGHPQNPYLIALIYALSFLAPYAYCKFILKKHYYSG